MNGYVADASSYVRSTEPQMTRPIDVATVCVRMCRYKQEVFRVLLLDARHRLLQKVMVSKGSLNASLVHPRDVFRRAIVKNAACIILVHNHPSGDPEPSSDDLELTTRLAKAGTLLGIEVLDHVIVAKNGYVSLRERGVF